MFKLARCSTLARLSCRASLSRAYSTAPNQAIIDLLQRCLKEENSSPTRNAYKVRSFQVALAAIYEHNKPIRSGQEAIKLRGIGLGIANRIDFFLQGKEYDEASEKQAKARLLAVEAFKKIPGIGVRTATNLVNAGATSDSDLHLPKYADLLSPSQKVNFLYRDHLTRPVSRSAAEEITAFIRDHISTNFEIHLTGSYRRDASDLPDVTILLHHPRHIHIPQPPPPEPDAPDNPSPTPRVRTRGKPPMPFFEVNSPAVSRQTSPLLQGVVRPLEAAALLAAPLIPGSYRWRGVALLPLRLRQSAEPGGDWQDVGDRLRDLRAGRGTYVRLDLRRAHLAPLGSRGAAQLALTGDEEFLRIARLAAARHGMHLDEYGLWRWHAPAEAALETHSPDDDDICAGYWELVEGENEERILDELALGFVPPARRNFRFLAGPKRASARAGMLDLGADTSVAKRGRSPRSHCEAEAESAAGPSGGRLGAVVVGAGTGLPEDIIDEIWVGTTKKA
ncbi:hypothetical protein EDB92DRAFT_2000020 [Lactarius akahatsu]|uniref:DNA polymerase n=1 Tax=Lactarius akahatsu TaxID=416441 RepID=A0AAD4LDJ2_9AGAM|nr:hypothetical protein EDB92DRAFT_1950778 [Lactarius akahatsu]KAH8990076.1 hypothetical protein EDB92DRAFT_2000020 [Lactarius akahatsu]